MKCPIYELFGRELRFESRRLLDLHSSRFHGLSVTQLQDRHQSARTEPIHPSDPIEARGASHTTLGDRSSSDRNI
jgi:hypothetical protein